MVRHDARDSVIKPLHAFGKRHVGQLVPLVPYHKNFNHSTVVVVEQDIVGILYLLVDDPLKLRQLESRAFRHQLLNVDQTQLPTIRGFTARVFKN